MLITQSWSGRFEEGTESYIPMNAPDYLTISELTVSDQNGSYDTVSDWNIDWGFKEKAGKCGIHDTDSGYEICFGISRYIEELEKLVSAIRAVAFPGAPEQSVGLGAVQAVNIASAPHVDAIQEIKKYKVLMQDGIIS